ncbi:MAG: helix-turn-helix domain-containing protein [Acidimicrobiaceae bacterium]|nr:helix-turn-helix domain-containing protein [Acidimicrobiaceae bacterium]
MRTEDQHLDQLVDTAEAAARLDCHRGTLERWAKEGRIPSVRTGRHLKFTVSDLQAFIEDNRTGTA